MHQPRFPKKKIHTVLLQALSLAFMTSATIPAAYAADPIMDFHTGNYVSHAPTDLSTTTFEQINIAQDARNIRIYTSKKYTLATPAGSTTPTILMLAGSTLSLNTRDIPGNDSTTKLKIEGRGAKSAAIWIGRKPSSTIETPIPTDQTTIFRGQDLDIIQKDAVGIDGKGSPNTAGDGSALTTLELRNSSITAQQGILWIDDNTRSYIDLTDVTITTTNVGNRNSTGLAIVSSTGSSTELVTKNLNISNKDTIGGGQTVDLSGEGVNASLGNSTLTSTDASGIRVNNKATAHFTGTTKLKVSSAKSSGQVAVTSSNAAKVTIDLLDMEYQSEHNGDFSGGLSAFYDGEIVIGQTGQSARSRIEVFTIKRPNTFQDTLGVNAIYDGVITLNSVDVENFRKGLLREEVSDQVVGLSATYGSHITLNDSTVTLKPADKDFPFTPVGADIYNNSSLTLNQGSRIEAGQFAVRMEDKSTLEMNDSRLTAGKAAIYAKPAQGKNQQDSQLVATLSNSELSALQKKPNDPLGAVVLLGTSYLPNTPAYMNMQVGNNSVLEGDYLYDVQLGMLDLKVDHSSLSGAARIAAPFSNSSASTPRSIVNVELNNGSVWSLLKDKDTKSASTAAPDYLHVNNLTLNQSTLAFAKPADKQNVQQFAIEKLDGKDSVIELWAELRDDSSATDQVVIRDQATGSTRLRIKRIDDGQEDGAQTDVGIKVVDANSGTPTNTATTAANAFLLDSGSTGYRSSTTPSLVAGLYDYYLVKGGNGGEEESWYLNSDLTVIPPDPDPDPDPDPKPKPDPDPDPKPKPDPDPDPKPDPDPDPDPTPFRPEVDAYFGNRQMAVGMQRHRWQERVNAQGPDRKAWARVSYQNERFNNQFGYKRKMDSSLLHLGTDLWQTSFADLSQLSVGAMALFSDGKTKTRNEQLKAEGKVRGYNIGVYATWQQQPNSDAGTYVDTWLMQGWFRNKVKGDGLAEEKYNSRSFSASIEGGYGFVVSETENARYYLQPQAQVIWSRFSANDVHEQTQTVVRDQGKNFTSYRVGLRFKAAIEQANGMQIAPFAELNYWRHPSRSRMTFNQTSAEDITPKNVLATTLGVNAQLSKSTSISGRVSYMMGNEKYRDSNVQIGVTYAW